MKQSDVFELCETREIGRASYAELSQIQRVTLAGANPISLRRILETAREEPKNTEMIAIIAAISLQSSMRPNLMHLTPLASQIES